jgi:hypothetical protein
MLNPFRIISKISNRYNQWKDSYSKIRVKENQQQSKDFYFTMPIYTDVW